MDRAQRSTPSDAQDLLASLARARDDLAELRARVDNAQRLADIGDFEWHIPTDTTHWSDHLYRIFGVEPGSFTPSYERLLAMVHPDDRDRIAEVHREALTSGADFAVVERIVRPGGEIRHLQTNGRVVRGADGSPERMWGVCVDVTDRVLADTALRASSTTFRSLVEASPDAVLVVGGAGQVLQANTRAAELLGADPVGHDLTHALEHLAPGSATWGVETTTLDGRPLLLDVTTAVLAAADGAEPGDLLAVFLHDAKDRIAGEEMAARLREAEVRRLQAFELNDSVVQSLTTAGQVLGQGDTTRALSLMEQTLAAARRLMDDWLRPIAGTVLAPGDLVRTVPSGRPPTAPHPRVEVSDVPVVGRFSVLVVDDDEDLRELFVLQIAATDDLEVVGQAGDGEAAVELSRRLRPDVVLLDMAMPLMDGLQALPRILAEAPDTRVIVVSAFEEASLGERALQLGAARYLEKGMTLQLPDAIRDALARS